jgi:ribonuclease HI
MKNEVLMAYICEKELMNVFEGLEPRLKAAGFEPEVALIRDYLLKIMIKENGFALGKLIVDYSPKKGSHSYRKDSDLTEGQFSRILGSMGVPVPVSNKTVSIKPAAVKAINSIPLKDVSHIKHHAYVDGSFIDGRVGYGAVILEEGNVIAEISGSVDTPEAFSARQVGGEIQATIEVLNWCKKNNVAGIAIFYDFQNIEKWATGQYKTNTPMTQAYKRYVDDCGIKIEWVKVESHTGVALNDRADELAKEGARL